MMNDDKNQKKTFKFKIKNEPYPYQSLFFFQLHNRIIK